MEKAGEARKKERALCRFKESNGLSDQINVDLTFAVDFNLAQTYHQNRLYQEALDAYTAIIKNKQLPQVCTFAATDAGCHCW
jgi:intraflagellar transport protein 88